MKFSIDCPEFKKAVEKAVALMPKACSLHILECLQLTTGDNAIVISTTNMEQYLKLEVLATIIEPGECFVDKNDIKKVYGLSGMVTVEVSDGKFTVHNSKKKSAVAAQIYDENDKITYPVMEDEELFIEMQEKDFVNTLAALSISLSDNESNKIMCGYNLDGKASRITTLDGFRFTFRRMQNCFKTESNVTMPSAVYNQLKKIIAGRRDDDIQVYIDKKYILFTGNGYQLWSRLFEGEYFQIDKLVPKFFDFSFNISSEEMVKIGKEYTAAVKGCQKVPMYLVYSSDDSLLRTGVLMRDYATVDVIEGFDSQKANGLDKDFLYGLNPSFIKDAMTLYDDTVECKGTYSLKGGNRMITPIFFDNGEYLSCVLPVNVDQDSIDKFNQFADVA